MIPFAAVEASGKFFFVAEILPFAPWLTVSINEVLVPAAVGLVTGVISILWVWDDSVVELVDVSVILDGVPNDI